MKNTFRIPIDTFDSLMSGSARHKAIKHKRFNMSEGKLNDFLWDIMKDYQYSKKEVICIYCYSKTYFKDSEGVALFYKDEINAFDAALIFDGKKIIEKEKEEDVKYWEEWEERKHRKIIQERKDEEDRINRNWKKRHGDTGFGVWNSD